jgi:hypothetical protein
MPLQVLWPSPPQAWRAIPVDDRLWPVLQGVAQASNYVGAALHRACRLVLAACQGPAVAGTGLLPALTAEAWSRSVPDRPELGGGAVALELLARLARARALGIEAYLQDPWEVVGGPTPVPSDDEQEESEEEGSAAGPIDVD